MFLVFLSSLFFLLGCSQGGSSPGGAAAGATISKNKGEISGWQLSALGQEGHGGDAIVCFSIPVEQALYKIDTNPEIVCPAGENCPSVVTGTPNDSTSKSTGIVWRMTEQGRKSIQSAKPLEQYLAERITNKKIMIDQLNQLSTQEGYEKLLMPFTKLPAAFSRLSEIHHKLGWLQAEGISSEYGLIDINDSGFVNENEIDKTRCKELQAVVRRDNQLWYDSDIVSHFDRAGLVLIQLHEEFYDMGKSQDKINRDIFGQMTHETSVKTRRLILKIIDFNLDENFVNDNLKDLGFSTLYWETTFNTPTPVGFFMTTDACKSEQQFLKNYLNTWAFGNDFWLQTEELFAGRYLKNSLAEPVLQLRFNYPNALSNMIALTFDGHNGGSSGTFSTEIKKLQQIFERPESCLGGF